MSLLPPEQETPVSLRAATVLSTPPAEAPATAIVVSQPAPSGTQDDAPEIDAATLLAAGAVLAVAAAWAMQRRRRLVPRTRPMDAAPASSAAAFERSEPAPPQRGRSRRSAHGARKVLMNFFMGLRSVAGAMAILAAIAIVVFWAIELIDSSARESGLTLTLLGFLLAGGACYWCAGRFANMLHRSVYNRDHPKFAD